MCLNLNNGKGRDERVRRDIRKIQISKFKLKKNEKGEGFCLVAEVCLKKREYVSVFRVR